MSSTREQSMYKLPLRTFSQGKGDCRNHLRTPTIRSEYQLSISSQRDWEGNPFSSHSQIVNDRYPFSNLKGNLWK